ncbi:tetratricopeptide repeat protein [Myroides sp. JBRI-B21084]|uniref:tetratricopeptide repeat protein n=1 Tax=Myroides sp. JBRI-B21084 TaxID=3119977 RepID=UPI0026E3732C|nr:tetratricopeptide repeat protein [Paenimyroides cloacae]WKW46289.1 tetratricopeptide repeat protein [Paenimyroides cloacae]
MNAQQYVQWLNNPYQLSSEQAAMLQNIVNQYPYLQSARALYLKTLHQQRSFLYNNELKKTAAYTTDRDVLFDYIISDEFIAYKPLQIEDVTVVDVDYIEFKKPEPTLDENIEKRLLNTLVYIENQEKETGLIQKIDQISKSKSEAKQEKNQAVVANNSLEQLEEKLEVGTPLDFSENDKFSFNEWLKLTSPNAIQQENEEDLNKNQPKTTLQNKEILENNTEETIPNKQKKMELIDRFIEANPKITPSKTAVTPAINLDRNEEEEPYYMTETLARIYLEQKKYQKAIQAYEILILKYPEKSSLFANRISDIKKLQEFNNI